VDDYPFMRELLVEVLTRANFEVAGSAGSARELLEGLAGWRPDVVILDILLPDGKGPDVTREVLARSPDLKILVISGLDEDEGLTADCLKAGAKRFLAKPFSAEKLVQALGEL
jgi:two-component system chemotaxis response regulator CheY